MKQIGLLFTVSILAGCATSIPKENYRNVTFADDGKIERVEFHITEPRNPDISLKSCVEKNVANESIRTRDYSNREAWGLPVWGVFGVLIDPEVGEIEPEQLILEASYDQVKAVGRIQYALDTRAPEAIRFLFTATDKETGMNYTFTELERIFPDINESNSHLLPDGFMGWQPWSTESTVESRFAMAHYKLSETARRVQTCLTFDRPADS